MSENLSLIDEIGLWVIEQSCLTYLSWSKKCELADDFSMAVNVSPYQLKNKNFAQDAIKIIHDLGVAINVIEFELTESSFDDE